MLLLVIISSDDISFCISERKITYESIAGTRKEVEMGVESFTKLFSVE